MAMPRTALLQLMLAARAAPPVVDTGDLQFLSYVDEHRTDFFREIESEIPGRGRLPVVDHPRRHRPNSPWHRVRGGEPLPFNRVHDARPVVFRIGLVVRVPRCFLTESDFPVDHCGNLAVVPPRSKPIRILDVAAQRGGQSARFGNFAASIRDQGFPVDLGHEVAIEFPAWVTGKALVEESPTSCGPSQNQRLPPLPSMNLSRRSTRQMIQLGLRVGFGKKFSGLDDRRALVVARRSGKECLPIGRQGT